MRRGAVTLSHRRAIAMRRVLGASRRVVGDVQERIWRSSGGRTICEITGSQWVMKRRALGCQQRISEHWMQLSAPGAVYGARHQSKLRRLSSSAAVRAVRVRVHCSLHQHAVVCAASFVNIAFQSSFHSASAIGCSSTGARVWKSNPERVMNPRLTMA